MVSLLLQWIQHHTVTFEERKFPASYEEIEVRVHQGQLLPGPPPSLAGVQPSSLGGRMVLPSGFGRHPMVWGGGGGGKRTP